MSNYDIEHMEMNQKAVYWAAVGVDDYGNPTIDSPTELDVRWEDIYEEALDPRAKTLILTAMVVVDVDVPMGSIFWKGSLTTYNATDSPSNYKQAVYFGNIPDLKAQYYRQTVKLINYSNTLPDLA